ncbi:MAG: hypothetical protein HYZ29_23875 [Myxococcales bacterium]|nr:hypothetical protein [Myxococcales bacterium]
MVRGGVTYRVLSDHLGSPRAQVDVATGTVAWRADFDAWGNRTLIAGVADFVPFGFAGGMLDAETGLTRFGARDYDPVVGRWTAKDPILFDGRHENLYSYAAFDPIQHRDPTGTKIIPDIDCVNQCWEDRKPELKKCAEQCDHIEDDDERAKCFHEKCSDLWKKVEKECYEKCDIVCGP